MTTFTNPILPGFYPDPSICRVGRDYYLVTSSFEYFPGVPIFHSRDLIHWTQLGHCLERASQLDLRGARASAGIYAPTLRHHAGVFYMTTTNTSHGGNFIVTAKDPRGPWSDPVWVEQAGIDPSLYFEDDGTAYYTTAASGALQSTVDVHNGKLLTEPRLVWLGSGGRYPEAPHLYRRQGRYYLILAEGGTEHGHMVTIARSSSPWGPFEACSRNPILTHRSYQSPIQNVGHADLVDAHDGSSWLVCLGTRPSGYPSCHHLGRETFLSPCVWGDDGFPIVGHGGRIGLQMEAPAWADSLEPSSDRERDDFDTRALAPVWNYLRNPEPNSYSLGERPGWLRLRGREASLNDRASPTFVGRRQRQPRSVVTTRLDFAPTEANEEAGLAVRMNEDHHYEMFVTCRDGKRVVSLRRRVGSLCVEMSPQPLPPGDIDLQIRANAQTFEFRFGLGEGPMSLLGEAETRYLSTEVAGGFTGAYLAMYATGNGQPCKAAADFDHFELVEIRGDVPAPPF